MIKVGDMVTVAMDFQEVPLWNDSMCKTLGTPKKVMRSAPSRCSPGTAWTCARVKRHSGSPTGMVGWVYDVDAMLLGIAATR